MSNDREEELKRLDQELFTITPEDLADYSETPAEELAFPQTDPGKKREDKWLIALMIIASALTIGIISVLIYWLEAFLT